jgi:hypothetical protein
MNHTVHDKRPHILFLHSQARVLYYMLMAAVEDEETQKQGMVGIAITIGNKQSFQFETARSMCAVAHALPNRWPTVHFW